MEGQEEIRRRILEKLQEIEQKEGVRILHAVESGSRSWGFASPDSDYDVRFIYVSKPEFYISLENKKDFISWELNDTFDINGWDLRKILQHFHRSNAVMFEWSNSPVVYYTTPLWKEIAEVAETYFSQKACMYHYYGTARKNAQEYLREEQVKYKKYLYVLRPLLACRYIEEKGCPPPMAFAQLMEAVLEPQLRPAMEKLLVQKSGMSEADKGPRIAELDAYICRQLEYYKHKIAGLSDDRKMDWEELNGVFRRIVQE